MFDILDRAGRRRFYGATDLPGAHDAIEGWEYLDKIVTIDQSAIGRSPRSNAATYTDAFTPIREAFAAADEARQRGLTAAIFRSTCRASLRALRGRGRVGSGDALSADVQVRCPACHGRRFKRDVLAVPYRGSDIARVLTLTVEEALALFQTCRQLRPGWG